MWEGLYHWVEVVVVAGHVVVSEVGLCFGVVMAGAVSAEAEAEAESL